MILKYLGKQAPHGQLYKNVVVKTDSNFFQTRKRQDPFDREFLEGFLNKASSLKATCQVVLISNGDLDIINSDHLSRESSSPVLRLDYNDENGEEIGAYDVENVTETVENITLSLVRDEMPGKYIVGYQNKYG